MVKSSAALWVNVIEVGEAALNSVNQRKVNTPEESNSLESGVVVLPFERFNVISGASLPNSKSLAVTEPFNW